MNCRHCNLISDDVNLFRNHLRCNECHKKIHNENVKRYYNKNKDKKKSSVLEKKYLKKLKTLEDDLSDDEMKIAEKIIYLLVS